MTQNRHGHHIKGTPYDDDEPYREVILCDGWPECESCFVDGVESIETRKALAAAYGVDSNDEGGRRESIGAPWRGLV